MARIPNLALTESLPRGRQEFRVHLLEGRRPDGRGPMEAREVELREYTIKNTLGAVHAVIPGSQVIAAVTLLVTDPYDLEDPQGTLIVDYEEFESNQGEYFSREDTRRSRIEYGRAVDKSLRGGGYILFENLLAPQEGRVYTVKVDIQVLENNGGIIDLSLHAVTHLLNTLSVDPTVLAEHSLESFVDVTRSPMSYTFGALGESTLLDPTNDEIGFLEGVYHVATNTTEVTSIQLLRGGVSKTQLETIINFLGGQE